jgi:ABC-type transport system involved in multi-copper enzyme maturation permease subunit
MPVHVAPVLTFAKLTVWEASRRKLLIAVVLLTLVVVGVTGWMFTQLRYASGPGGGPEVGEVQLRLIASQTLIVVVFLFAGVLALMSVLVAAPSISGDVESNLVLAMLARPVRRSELVLGKWLGLAALVVVYSTGSGVLELVVIDWATGYVPPEPVQLIAYVAALGLVLLTLALLLSTRMAGMTAAIIPLAAYFMAWVGGIMGGIGQAIGNQGLIATGVVSRLVLPTDGLWRGAVYAMEPASVVAALRTAGNVGAGNPFGATDGPAPAFLAWTVIWFALMIALTLWSFRRREL